jgi:hypothetical protein
MCNGYTFKAWQEQCLDGLSEHPNTQLCLIIMNEAEYKPHNPFRSLCYKIFTRFFWKPVSIINVDLQQKLKGIPVIRCKPILKGRYSQYFEENDIYDIRKYGLDFIIRFGFNILRGDILNVAHFGVWSFHHGDEQKYRGGPPGFWEIFNDDPVSGLILQRLTDKLDAGIILRKGYLKTIKHSYKENTDHLFFGGIDFPVQVCTDILNQQTGYIESTPSSTQAKIYKQPGNVNMLHFICKLFMNKLFFHLRDLFCTEKWSYGIIKQPIHELLNEDIKEKDIIWAPECNSRCYQADVFGFTAQNGHMHLVEYYDYARRKGIIAYRAFNPDTGRFSALTPLFEQSFHMAYPYVFTYKENVYCIPETADNQTVELYQFNAEKQSMEFVTALIRGIDAVDATLIEFKGMWWMFCTRKQHGTNEKLFVYYSEQLTGPYKPHACNPVKTDIRSSRPAGTPFMYNGCLYRPVQDSSVNYGKCTHIMKIEKLDQTSFHEEYVKTIYPFKYSRYNAGLHTISKVGDFILFDSKRYQFIFSSFKHKFKQKIFREKKHYV